MSTIEILLVGILPIIISVLFYIISALYSKLNDLDARLRGAMSQHDARLLIEDKISPIREDIRDMTAKLDRILDIYFPQK